MQLGPALVSLLVLASQGVAAVSSQKLATAPAGTPSGSPWFSLLTKSWALAGESEPEQTKGLDDLAKNIVELARSGAPDESMSSAIESIRQIVADMKGVVNDSHAVAQGAIYKKAKAVSDCKVPAHTDPKYLDSVLVHGDHSIEELLKCRAVEVKHYDAWQHCLKEKARCSNTTECCAPLVQPSKYCLSPGMAPSPLPFEATCEGLSRCKEDDVSSKLDFFRKKLSELDAAEKACDDSRKGCLESYDCEAKLKVWQTQRSDCNVQHTSFEQGFCDLATNIEASWDSYGNCYESNVQQLSDEEKHQMAQLPGRQQEWRGLLRIDCLLGALVSADSTKALEACIDKSYTASDWSHLELEYPTNENLWPLRANCSEPLMEPGTRLFSETYYFSLWKKYGDERFATGSLRFLLLPDKLKTFACVSGLSSNNCPRAKEKSSLAAVQVAASGQRLHHVAHGIKHLRHPVLPR